MSGMPAGYDAWLTTDPRDDGGLSERVTEEVLQDLLDLTFFGDAVDLVSSDLADALVLRRASFTLGGDENFELIVPVERWSKKPKKWAWVIDVWQNTDAGRMSLEKIVEERIEDLEADDGYDG